MSRRWVRELEKEKKNEHRVGLMAKQRGRNMMQEKLEKKGKGGEKATERKKKTRGY